MTNGEFFEALELLGYETIEDCPLSEERVENVAKRIAELETQLRQEREAHGAAGKLWLADVTKLQAQVKVLEITIGELREEMDRDSLMRGKI